MPQIVVISYMIAVYIFDLLLGVVGAHFLSSLTYFVHIENFCVEFLGFTIGHYLGIVLSSLILQLPVVFLCHRSLGALLLGVSYGIKGTDLQQRTTAYLYFALSFFTGHSRRTRQFVGITLKLKRLDDRQSIVLGMVFVFVSIAAYLSPYFFIGRSLDAIPESKVFFKGDGLQKDLMPFASRRLQLEGNINETLSKTWHLFPGLMLVKKGDKTTIGPYLKLHSREQEITAKLKRGRRLDIHQFARSYFQRYFYLSHGNIEELIRTSFTTGYNKDASWFEVLLRKPFVQGQHAFREAFLLHLQLPEITTFFFSELGGKKQVFFKGAKSQATGEQRLLWFSLEEEKPYIYDFSWIGGGEELYRPFLSLLFQFLYYTDENSLQPYPKEAENIHVPQLMDMLVDKKLSKEQRKVMEEALHSFYFNYGKKVLLSNHVEDKNVMTKEFLAFNTLVQVKKKEFSIEFIKKWEEMMLAVQYFDRSFFKLKD